MFHRYLTAPSKKDHENMNRSKKSTIAPKVSVELENIFSEVGRKAFLCSPHNKQKFINLPAVRLTDAQVTLIQCLPLLFLIMLVMEVMRN